MWFAKSADGLTWDAPILLPTDKGDPTSEFVSIADDGKGNLAVSSNGGNNGLGMAAGRSRAAERARAAAAQLRGKIVRSPARRVRGGSTLGG